MRESGGGNKVVSMTVCGVFGCWIGVHLCNMCVSSSRPMCWVYVGKDKITCGDWDFEMFFPEAHEVGSCLLGGSDVTCHSMSFFLKVIHKAAETYSY